MTVILAILVIVAFAVYIFYTFQEQQPNTAQRKPLKLEHDHRHEDMELAEDYSFDFDQTGDDLEDDFLPEFYEEDRLVLMAKDPDWLYAYWEITDNTRRFFEEQTREKAWLASQPVLRIYNLTAGNYFDIKINDKADSWYIWIKKPNTKYKAEIGRIYEGKYYKLIQSNHLISPVYGFSEIFDPQWLPSKEIWRSLGSEYEFAYGSNHLTKNE